MSSPVDTSPWPIWRSTLGSKWVHWHLTFLCIHLIPSWVHLTCTDEDKTSDWGGSEYDDLVEPCQKNDQLRDLMTQSKTTLLSSLHPKTARRGKGRQFLRDKGGVGTWKLLEQEVKKGIEKPVTILLLFCCYNFYRTTCISIWSQIPYIAEELWTPAPSPSISQVLGLQACVVTPSFMLAQELNLLNV